MNIKKFLLVVSVMVAGRCVKADQFADAMVLEAIKQIANEFVVELNLSDQETLTVRQETLALMQRLNDKRLIQEIDNVLSHIEMLVAKGYNVNEILEKSSTDRSLRLKGHDIRRSVFQVIDELSEQSYQCLSNENNSVESCDKMSAATCVVVGNALTEKFGLRALALQQKLEANEKRGLGLVLDDSQS